MPIKIYGAATSLIYAIAYPYLRRRYATGFDERRGIYDPDKIQRVKNAPNGSFWVHAVSVGEVQAAVPFISRIKEKFPTHPIILSTTTTTGAKMAVNMGAKCDVHIYYPWDTPSIITRALDNIAPMAFIAVESEIWPLFLTELKRRNIPSFLINGRISDRSFKRMKKVSSLCPDFLTGLLSSFDAIMVKEETDSERLQELGVPHEKITVTGDCKIDAVMERTPPLLKGGRGDCGALAPLRASPAIPPPPTAVPLPLAREDLVFVAGSTHPGEDEKIFEAFDIVKKELPSSRLIIVPRHPERAKNVAALANAVLYSEFEKNQNINWDILVVDKIGLLFGLYGMANAAFVGGSLVPKGGQNLMEPALFGVPTCHGRYMDDFRVVAHEFDELGISKEINSSAEIAEFWLKSAHERDCVCAAAQKWFGEHGGASEKSASIIAEFLKIL